MSCLSLNHRSVTRLPKYHIHFGYFHISLYQFLLFHFLNERLSINSEIIQIYLLRNRSRFFFCMIFEKKNIFTTLSNFEYNLLKPGYYRAPWAEGNKDTNYILIKHIYIYIVYKSSSMILNSTISAITYFGTLVIYKTNGGIAQIQT